MYVFVSGNRYKSSIQKRIEKDRVCEKCGCHFKHNYTISSKGLEVSFFGIGEEEARRRANSVAEKNLENVEKRNNPLFPCPTCGWFQSDMVRTRKKYLLSNLLMVALTVPGFCTVLAILAGVIICVGDGWQFALKQVLGFQPLWAMYLVCGLLVSAVFISRKLSNPNRNYNSIKHPSANTAP